VLSNIKSLGNSLRGCSNACVGYRVDTASRLIMVIKLSGVQFGLKSYVWFQNQTRAVRSFDLKSQIRFQTKIARPEVQLPLYYIHIEIAQFNSLNTNHKILVSTIIYWTSSRFVKKWNQKYVCISFWKHVSIVSTWCNSVMWLVVLVYCLIPIGWEKDAI